MAYSKIIQIGQAGSLSINEADGIASIAIAVAESVGGGSVAGVAKAKLSAEVDVSALMLMDAGLELAAAKFPSFAAEIALVKAALDAEAAKV